NFTLFTTDVKVVPGSAKLQNSVGGELITQAIKPENSARKTQMLKEAVQHLTEAVRVHPGYKNAFLLLGNAHNYLKQYDLSIQYFEQALQLDPNYAEARTNLGITYRDAGRYFGEQQGDVAKALQYLEKAYQLRPDEYETLRLLGVAYGISGQGAKAVEFFAKALAAEPQNADAFFNLGTAWYNIGEIEKANEYFQKAKSINPNIEEERRGRQ
ncbi:MAG: tetratricopeptide repeat protein, partial [Saprospiraceae bacterium]